MSKSKGNTLDPLDIIDGINLSDLSAKRTEGLMQPQMKERIKKQTKKDFPEGINAYGTDALRLTFCSLATGGRDINFDMKRVEGYRNFCNKLWNAARFILMNLEDYEGTAELIVFPHSLTERNILSRLNRTADETGRALEEFKFNEAASTLYRFVWNEFCDWYIEEAKTQLFFGGETRKITQNVLLHVLEKSLRLLHPFMPFITEEIWQKLPGAGLSIMVADYPSFDPKKDDPDAEVQMKTVRDLVSVVRNIRGEMNIPAKRLFINEVVCEGCGDCGVQSNCVAIQPPSG